MPDAKESGQAVGCQEHAKQGNMTTRTARKFTCNDVGGHVSIEREFVSGALRLKQSTARR
jgi:hypothetical protein